MHLPIGFGGSYEENWRYPHDPYLHQSYWRQSSGPHWHSRWQRQPYGTQHRKTMMQKVDDVRRELSISPDLNFLQTISEANAILGFEDTGTLTHKLDNLIHQLELT